MLPDKYTFFTDLGYEPHPGQRAVHDSTASRRVVACGARWGKTLCASMEALAAAMAPSEECKGWVVGPTYDLANRVFRVIVDIALRQLSPYIIAIKETERRLVLRNLGAGVSEIQAKSADSPRSLLGEGLDFVIIDEASRLNPSIWHAYLSQRLLDKQGWALLISTPFGKGYFFELYRRGQGQDPDFMSWNAPSWQNPLLDQAAIERERLRLPERDFLEQYAARFVEGSGAVFRCVRECAVGVFQEAVPGERYYAGLDLAKVHDFTVLVIVNRRREVVFVDRFQHLDWSTQVSRICGIVGRYGNPPICTDTTGIGEPIYEMLIGAGLRVQPYPFTNPSKTALINNLVLRLEERSVVLPRPDLWPEGIDELESFHYSTTDAGNIRMGAPSGSHDDCVIALALAVWEPSPRLHPVKMAYRVGMSRPGRRRRLHLMGIERRKNRQA